MLSYLRRIDHLTPKQWITVGVASTVVVTGGVAYEMMRRNRITAVLNDSDCVKRVEIGRYPCEVLHGYDVVVANHFYKETKVSEPIALWLRRSLLPVWLQEDPMDGLSPEYRNGRGERVSDDVKSMQKNRLANVRIAQASESEASLTSSARSTALPTLSPAISEQWPVGTNRYCGMTIEPSISPDVAQIENRGFLRSLVDKSTQQTLVKCTSLRPNTTASSTSPFPCESSPEFLSAPYLRSMLGVFGLLPNPLPPLRVCFLGVGGGALPMFIQRHFASSIARLDLVDVEPQVLTAAAELMGLRTLVQGSPLNCYAADAAAFLQHPNAPRGGDVSVSSFVDETGQRLQVVKSPSISQIDREPYDVIFVDVFVGSETPAHLQHRDFMKSVQQSLSTIGVAAFNLPSYDRDFVKDCNEVFGHKNVFVSSCRHSANNVVFAMKRNSNDGMSRRHILRRVTEVCRVHRLPYDVSANFPIWWTVV